MKKLVFGREPVLIFAVVQAIIGAVVVFGFDLTKEQIIAIETITLAILSLIVRYNVTPTKKVEDQQGV